MADNFSQVNVRHQITDPSSERTTRMNDKRRKKKKTKCRHIISSYRKIKRLKYPWRSNEKKLTYCRATVKIISSFSETTQIKENGVKYFKCWEEKKPTKLEFCILQNCSSKMKEKYIFFLDKNEGICCKWTYLARNVKISSSEKENNTSQNLHKERKKSEKE